MFDDSAETVNHTGKFSPTNNIRRKTRKFQEGCALHTISKWGIHVADIVSRASRRLFTWVSLKKHQASLADLISAYPCYIRPVLEYASQVWHSSLGIDIYPAGLHKFRNMFVVLLLVVSMTAVTLMHRMFWVFLFIRI